MKKKLEQILIAAAKSYWIWVRAEPSEAERMMRWQADGALQTVVITLGVKRCIDVLQNARIEVPVTIILGTSVFSRSEDAQEMADAEHTEFGHDGFIARRHSGELR